MRTVTIAFFAGTISGMLVAPDSGHNTRKKIRAAITWLPRKLHHAFEKGYCSATTKIESVAERVDRKLQKLSGDAEM